MLYGALFCAGLSLCAATFYQWHQWLPTELAKHSEKGFLQFHMQRITLAKAFYFIMGIVCIVSALLFFTPLANGLLRGPLFVDGEWHCTNCWASKCSSRCFTHTTCTAFISRCCTVVLYYKLCSSSRPSFRIEHHAAFSLGLAHYRLSPHIAREWCRVVRRAVFFHQTSP